MSLQREELRKDDNKGLPLDMSRRLASSCLLAICGPAIVEVALLEIEMHSRDREGRDLVQFGHRFGKFVLVSSPLLLFSLSECPVN